MVLYSYTHSEIRLLDSQVSGNSAALDGGGMLLYSEYYGNHLIDRTSVTSNLAARDGGGVAAMLYYASNPRYPGSATISNSTLAGNHAARNGGGLFVPRRTELIFLNLEYKLTNSTVSGNEAGHHGGGVYLSPSNKLTVSEATIADNTANVSGGGIYSAAAQEKLQLRTTLVGDNVLRSGTPNDFAGAAEVSFVLIESNAGTLDIVGPVILGEDPQLGPLQDNGGPTFTQALAFGSPAIDAGPNTSPQPWDQRGSGFDRRVGDAVDIGAFESQDTLFGDFNRDGHFDCLDIDELSAAVASGLASLPYDLNSDGVVDVHDIGQWLVGAGRANLPGGSPYRMGDANLDGVVDGRDFALWNNHKFTTTSGWCAGNFNGDAVVDGRDFAIWNANRFLSSLKEPWEPLPEPLNRSRVDEAEMGEFC